MPLGKYFNFSVFTGQVKLPEYKDKTGESYIESVLDAKCSYSIETRQRLHGEIEEQECPVTPYEIKIEPRCSGTAWYELYIDGVYVWNKPLKQGKVWTVNGYKDEDVFRELLFSLPRLSDDENDRSKKVKSRNKEDLGLIKVKCIEAIYLGKQQRAFNSIRDFSNSMGTCENDGFKAATKQECGSKGLAATAAGREIFRYTRVDGRQTTYRGIERYARGKVLEELSVSYRLKPVLVEMGLVTDENIKPKSEKITPKKRSKTERKKIKQEKLDVKVEDEFQVTVDETMNKFSNLSTGGGPLIQVKREVIEEVENRVNSDGKSYQVLVRKELQPKQRAVVLNEEIAVLEELDDSVVCIGDEECLVIEAPLKEIPVLNLDESFHN